MLTGLTIVFLGGDARQLEVIGKCTEQDATVKLAGFDQLQPLPQGVTGGKLTEDLMSEADVLILPVLSCSDTGVISTSFSEEKPVLKEELIAALPKHALIYTGVAKPYLLKLCEKYGIKVIQVLDRDDVAIYNSIPTAEGALMLAIQNTDITLHGSTSVVLGMGRTGFTMARTLQGIGARVKMGVRRKDHFARAEEMGWNPFLTQDLADEASGADLIFNTIPNMIITAQVLSKLSPKVVIIDLASAPGGTDFRFAEKRGIKAILAPGLPGIVAPRTAGIIMANCICQSLEEELTTRGDEW
ncbi:dipicolinate synthase subunit DpsA [Paenibacillus physcomitrellae]|uniref:Dipicolinate synthase subunit A n=1 Tax=Paenibacillus physcomitrellae TaxID=1619311 RepID=A0ABQ1G9L3_9BACL|nr:dipicolinate synthase subunit DpsA [Paenibacillus physcomitrellae]GGA39352.1 dipicolinate synthase subunit A [Paenibacillus physcomitrellae]